MSSISDGQECHRCEGTGKIYAFVDGHTADGRPWGDLRQITCRTCEGEGVISADRAERMRIGLELREKRRATGKTLLEAASELGISPAELSRREQGRGD